MISEATHVKIDMVNASEGYLIYEDVLCLEDLYLTDDNLYKSMQAEYGRCISKVYIDTDDPMRPKPIGWVFQRRMKYDFGDKTFLQETWIVPLKSYDPRPRMEYAGLDK